MLLIKAIVLLSAIAGLGYWSFRAGIIKINQRNSSGDIGEIPTFKLKPGVIVRGVLSFIVVAIIGTLLSSFVSIQDGTRGVVKWLGRVEDRTLEPGLNFVIPIVEDVSIYDIKEDKVTGENIAAASKDLQDTFTDFTLTYRLDPKMVGTIYKTQGTRADLENKIIGPVTLDAIKASVSKFKAEELIQSRKAVRQMIAAQISERLSGYGVIVKETAITNFSFSDTFSAAIEAKQVEEQKAQKAENELKRINVEAEQTIAKAKAEAERIQLEAEALRSSPEIIQKQFLEKWDGTLPKIISGDGVNFLMDIGEMAK